MTAFISKHLGDALIAFWVYSAAVSAMPPITMADGKGYQWLYHFTHTLAGDLSAYFQQKK